MIGTSDERAAPLPATSTPRGAPAPRTAIHVALEHRFSLLVVLALGWLGTRGPGASDWFWMSLGARRLFGEDASISAAPGSHSTVFDAAKPGGLHLYASFPQVKVGPLTLVLDRLAMDSPTGALWASSLLVILLLLISLVFAEQAARAYRPPVNADDEDKLRLGVLAGGVLLVLGWSELSSHWAHLDDALTLAAAAVAFSAVAKRQPLVVGTMIGVALAAKPTALMLIPLLLVLPSTRARVRAVGAAVGIGAAVWLPFVIAAPATAAALSYPGPAQVGSPLELLLGAGATVPVWGRLAQLLLGWALAGVAIRRGKWPALLLLGAASRFLLEPGDASYYATSVVAGAFLWDLMADKRRLPWMTTLTFVTLLLPRYTLFYLSLPHLATARALGTIAPVVLLVGAWAEKRRTDERHQPDAQPAVALVSRSAVRG